MVISGTIGAHIQILIPTQVSEGQNVCRVIQIGILGEHQVIVGAARVTGTAIHGPFQATLIPAIAPLGVTVGAGDLMKLTVSNAYIDYKG